MNKATIEKAAKTLAAQFDYPWEHMPEQGRDNMRRIAGMVITDAVAEERERCAKICEAMEGHPIELDRYDYANAIREGANHAE